jgi:pilus assembly protein TadC
MTFLTALLFSFSIAAFFWFMATKYQEQNITEARIKQIKRSNTVFQTVSSELETKKFFRSEQYKKRAYEIQTMIFSAAAIPFAMAWYGLDPTNFLLKILSAFVCILSIRKLWVKIQRKKLITAMEEELPSMLDLLMICIEAGMSINAALVRVSSEVKNSLLANEFRITFHELNASVTVEEAFRHLADRTQVPDLQALAAAIIQSEKLGIGLGETLRTQSRLLRETIRMRTKEKILKVPVKMIVPLALCILPAIFVVIIGPAFLQISSTFVFSGVTPEP